MEVKPLCCPVELSEGNSRIQMTSSSTTESAEFYLIFLAMINFLKKSALFINLILPSSKKTDI